MQICFVRMFDALLEANPLPRETVQINPNSWFSFFLFLDCLAPWCKAVRHSAAPQREMWATPKFCAANVNTMAAAAHEKKKWIKIPSFVRFWSFLTSGIPSTLGKLFRIQHMHSEGESVTSCSWRGKQRVAWVWSSNSMLEFLFFLFCFWEWICGGFFFLASGWDVHVCEDRDVTIPQNYDRNFDVARSCCGAGKPHQMIGGPPETKLTRVNGAAGLSCGLKRLEFFSILCFFLLRATNEVIALMVMKLKL